MNRRVLVVEDDEDVREMMSLVLSGVGYSVVTCADGAEALGYLHHNGAAPAVILLDLRMPRVNGIEFARALQADGRTIPIVLVSGDTSARDVAHGIGAAECLFKPVDLDELLRAVREHAAW